MYSIVLSLGNHQDLDIVLLTLLLYDSKLASFHTRLEIQQLVAAEKVLINVLLYILLIQIFHDRLIYKGRYHVLHVLLYILPLLGFYWLNFVIV